MSLIRQTHQQCDKWVAFKLGIRWGVILITCIFIPCTIGMAYVTYIANSDCLYYQNVELLLQILLIIIYSGNDTIKENVIEPFKLMEQ